MMKLEGKEVFSWLEETGSLTLHVQGTSMCPFLYDGADTVTLQKPKKIKKGDVVVFERNGYYIMHRVVRIKNGLIDTLGDNLAVPERDIPIENVVAVVTQAVRKGKTISPKSPIWQFFSKIYIHPSARKAARFITRR